MSIVEESTADISILLVEDDEDDRFLVRQILDRTKYRIHLDETENGLEAVEFLNSRAVNDNFSLPDLIIMDLNMPVMDGRECLKSIRSSDKTDHLPVIILTTSIEKEVLQEARALGANATLIKGDTFSNYDTLSEMIVEYWFSGSIDWDMFEPRASDS